MYPPQIFEKVVRQFSEETYETTYSILRSKDSDNNALEEKNNQDETDKRLQKTNVDNIPYNENELDIASRNNTQETWQLEEKENTNDK